MKKIYLLFILSALSTETIAQWEKRIGINLLPLSVRSLEITSEFSRRPRFAFTVNAGYVYNSPYEGISGIKVYDGVQNRKTSGPFLKVGSRFYFMKPKVTQKKVNIFAGVLLVGAYYDKKADTEVIYSNFPTDVIFKKTTKKGFSWGPAMTAGLTLRINRRIDIDAGIQYGFMIENNQNIGRKDFNYEPGFGTSKTPALLIFVPPLALLATHAQAIVTLKYRL